MESCQIPTQWRKNLKKKGSYFIPREPWKDSHPLQTAKSLIVACLPFRPRIDCLFWILFIEILPSLFISMHQTKDLSFSHAILKLTTPFDRSTAGMLMEQKKKKNGSHRKRRATLSWLCLYIKWLCKYVCIKTLAIECSRSIIAWHTFRIEWRRDKQTTNKYKQNNDRA